MQGVAPTEQKSIGGGEETQERDKLAQTQARPRCHHTPVWGVSFQRALSDTRIPSGSSPPPQKSQHKTGIVWRKNFAGPSALDPSLSPFAPDLLLLLQTFPFSLRRSWLSVAKADKNATFVRGEGGESKSETLCILFGHQGWHACIYRSQCVYVGGRGAAVLGPPRISCAMVAFQEASLPFLKCFW